MNILITFGFFRLTICVRNKDDMISINYFKSIRRILIKIRAIYLTKLWGMDIHPTAILSLSSKMDKVFPVGVHIGEKSYVAFEARILTHDMVRGVYTHTRIGKNCFIGGRSTILPGVHIGDGCIIGACSVVTKDIPPYSIAVGNPAHVVKSGIQVGEYGRLIDADKNERKYRAENNFNA